MITVCVCSLLQPSLLFGHVLIVSGDFIVTSLMTVELCPATVSALMGNTVLTELSLASCNIDAEGTSHLAQVLCDITTLRVLWLSGNTVDSQGTRHLGKLSGEILGYGLTCNIRLSVSYIQQGDVFCPKCVQNVLVSVGKLNRLC